ncbi:Cro/CI family transcriptional regulator [Pantoea vagans]|uniref:Cro/CI family transcriptional regulator n=1 Tax=Pantoea vagans TaxID=470934 RepID=UPI003B01CB2F
MLTSEAIAFFGDKRLLAKAAGVRVPSVYAWGEYVPEGRALRLERASNGTLKYDPAVYDEQANKRRKGSLIHENQPQGCDAGT